MTTTIPEFLTVDQAAEQLGLSRNAVYAEVRSGRLPARRLGPKGGKIRLTADDLACYLAACRAAPPAPRRRALKFIRSPRP